MQTLLNQEKKKITNRRKTDWCSSRMHTDDPWSTTRVRKAQGKPKPSRMSKILLPMEFDTAMSPMPEERQERLNWSICITESKTGKRCVTLLYLVELRSDLPCSLERWSPLPGRLCPWCSLGCLVCGWWWWPETLGNIRVKYSAAESLVWCMALTVL